MASIDEAKEIIKSTPISTIITYYHPISKKGANFEGICPFHGDTSPSLKINDGKGIYKCFACGAAGDAIKFVSDKLSLDFIEAVKDISSNLGIEIEERKKNTDPKFDMALRVLAASNKIYKKVANEISPKIMQDFLKSRNINEESVQNFQIGFAPANNAITSYLGSLPDSDKKFALDVAQMIGLIRPNKMGPKEGHYDFYRDRVIFPIWDHSGKVRGYSSRAVKPDQKPKYLNSGESFIFDKGNILYGFNLAKKDIREQDSVIIVEGNMDALMLHQYGFKNSVATMGVSLSLNSIKLLKNMTKNFYLAMDSDPAGIKAMDRINLDLLSNEIVAKYIDFSPSKDPDEFLNEFGRLELLKRIEEAPTYIDFAISRITPEEIPNSTDQKLKILREIFGVLSPLKTNLMATEKLIQCAGTLGLKSSPDDIISEYKNFLANNQTAAPTTTLHVKEEELNNFNSLEEINSEQKPTNITTTEIPKVQAQVLKTFLSHPECIEGEQITEILDFIDHFEVKRIVQWLKKIYREIDESDYVFIAQAKLNEPMPEKIKEIFNSSLRTYEPTKLNQKVISKMLDDLIFKLKEDTLKVQRDLLKEKQKSAQTDLESLEILGEIQNIEKKLLDIRKK